MNGQRTVGTLVSVICMIVLAAREGSAAESSTSESGPMQRIEETTKQVGKSIEESMKNTVKKVEEEHIPEKVEKKIKQAVDETVEAFEKTGKNIQKKFGQ
jgi:gas vesicle protein